MIITSTGFYFFSPYYFIIIVIITMVMTLARYRPEGEETKLYYPVLNMFSPLTDWVVGGGGHKGRFNRDPVPVLPA